MTSLTVALDSCSGLLYSPPPEMLPRRAWNADSTMCGRAVFFKSAHYESPHPAAGSPNGRPLEPPAVCVAGLSGSNSMTRALRACHRGSTTDALVRRTQQ